MIKTFIGRRVMEIDNLTLGQIKQLKNLLGGVEQLPLPFAIGEKVFIRTVTHYLTGQVKEIVGKFLILTEAAWIADSGRFFDFLEKGIPSEVEPIPDSVRINSDTIVDAFPWNHALPKVQK